RNSRDARTPARHRRHCIERGDRRQAAAGGNEDGLSRWRRRQISLHHRIHDARARLVDERRGGSEVPEAVLPFGLEEVDLGLWEEYEIPVERRAVAVHTPRVIPNEVVVRLAITGSRELVVPGGAVDEIALAARGRR